MRLLAAKPRRRRAIAASRVARCSSEAEAKVVEPEVGAVISLGRADG